MNKALTPAREQLFKSAMRSRGTPESFRGLADQFEKYGLPIEANLLRKRAASREMPPEDLEKRKNVIRAAFSCTDPAKVLGFADVCEGEGMTTTAGKLRKYAATLQKMSDSGVRRIGE